MNKETYIQLHERLMKEMRTQTALKNNARIERTGKRLYRLRRRYRARFAS